MGLAVKLYNRFTVQESDKLSFVLKGKYTDNIPINENNLVWKTMLKLWQKIGFPIKPVQITLDSEVPPARGLGSSSTAVVGGLMIANVLAGSPFDKYELLKIATEIEGHPDNVTPAIYGGITLTVMTEDNVIPRVLAKDPDFRTVVIIPDILVKQKKQEKSPSSVSRQDAVYILPV
jgi:homoserine kinase